MPNYDNPFYVHKIENSRRTNIPESREKLISSVANVLERNYFRRACERYNCPEFKDHDFTDESLKAYILVENAKMIYSNSFNPTDEEPGDEVFQEMVDLAITNLTKCRNFTHNKKQINT